MAGWQPFKTGPRAWNINYLRTKTALLLSRLGVEPLSPPAIRGMLIISFFKKKIDFLQNLLHAMFYFEPSKGPSAEHNFGKHVSLLTQDDVQVIW